MFLIYWELINSKKLEMIFGIEEIWYSMWWFCRYLKNLMIYLSFFGLNWKILRMGNGFFSWFWFILDCFFIFVFREVKKRLIMNVK